MPPRAQQFPSCLFLLTDNYQCLSLHVLSSLKKVGKSLSKRENPTKGDEAKRTDSYLLVYIWGGGHLSVKIKG